MADNTHFREYWKKIRGDGVLPALHFYDKGIVHEMRPLPVEIFNPLNKDYHKYVVSNTGFIYNTESQTTYFGFPDKDGYFRAAICNRMCAVHRIILMAFDPNPDFKSLQVNHKDGIKQHNWITNLEWMTNLENTRHAMRTGLHKMNGTDNPNNKLSEDEVHEICKLIQTCKYHDIEIAEMYNVSYANISDIHKGKIWKHISCNYDLSRRKPPKKLWPEQVESICQLFEDGELLDTQIAKQFNVSVPTIREIRHGNIWRKISDKYNIKNAKSFHRFN